jgi:hypothetical protein
MGPRSSLFALCEGRLETCEESLRIRVTAAEKAAWASAAERDRRKMPRPSVRAMKALWGAYRQQTVVGPDGVTVPDAVAVPPVAHEPPDGVTTAPIQGAGVGQLLFSAHVVPTSAVELPVHPVVPFQTVIVSEHETPEGAPQVHPFVQPRVSVPEL